LISGFALPADDVYTIVVGGFAVREQGAFTLRTSNDVIRSAVEDEYGYVTEQVDCALLEGETVVSSLPAHGEQDCFFDGVAGQIVRITTDAQFDSTLSLLDDSGNVIAFNDDFGGSLNS